MPDFNIDPSRPTLIYPPRSSSTRAKCFLLVVPIILVSVVWLTRTVHRTAPPLPPATAPAPRPTLLTDDYREWYSVIPTPDGKKIITGSPVRSSEYIMQVWDAKSLRLMLTFGSQRFMSPLEVTPDGKQLIVGMNEISGRRVIIYDVGTGRQILKMASGTGTCDFTLSPDGKRLALGMAGSMEVRDLKTGRVVSRMPRWLLNPAASWASSPTFTPDGRRIAFVDDLEESQIAYANGAHDEIGFFSSKTGRKLRTFGWANMSLSGIKFSPGGKLLVVLGCVYHWKRPTHGDLASEDRLLLCDARTGKVQRSIATPPQMHAIAFSPDGRWLAIGSYGQGVQVWDTHSGKLHLSWQCAQDGVGAGGYVHSLNFMPDGRTLLIGSHKVIMLPVPPN